MNVGLAFVANLYDVAVFASVMAQASPITKLTQLFNQIINWATGLAVVVATAFLIFGAYRYMTASGNPRHMENAKTHMMNAVIGLGLIFAARSIAELVRRTIA